MADDIREALKAAQNHHPDDILKYLGLVRVGAEPQTRN